MTYISWSDDCAYYFDTLSHGPGQGYSCPPCTCSGLILNKHLFIMQGEQEVMSEQETAPDDKKQAETLKQIGMYNET